MIVSLQIVLRVRKVSDKFCGENQNLHFLLQGGSNMIGTDLYVKNPHWAAAVRP